LSLTLLIGGGFLASIMSGGPITVVAAASPPRIRSQSFAAFGLALAVCGAAAAPVVVGALSELFQHQFDANEGEALRYAILVALTTVTSLGIWFTHKASLSADADVQRTMAEFIAEHTAQHM
jgi:MFS family permease